MAREFIDTNILVYAFTADPKSVIAATILQRRCVTSVQALNEFVNVARRKLAMDWAEIDEALKAIRILCSAVYPIDLEIHERAVKLAERHGFAIFDALMVASALKSGADTLHSEDMQHGMLIEGQLRISNPFRKTL